MEIIKFNMNEGNKCTHCGTQLPKINSSKLCKNCRMKGHREFGKCQKCMESGRGLLKTFYDDIITSPKIQG
jgi:predicted amidophosphoribosyltransferase